MEYGTNVVVAFADRTLRNLAKIREIEREELSRGIEPREVSVFPITEQINALLGLVVFPKERGDEFVPNMTLAQLVLDGWPDLEILRPAPLCLVTTGRRQRQTICTDQDCLCADHALGDKALQRCQSNHRECKTLRDLLWVLRNGVSHFNLEFGSSSETHEIVSVEISNRCTCCDTITTTVRLTVEQIGEFAEKYARLIAATARCRA